MSIGFCILVEINFNIMFLSNSLKIALILFASILFAQEKLKVEFEVIPSYQTKEKNVKIILKNTYYNLIIDQNESEFVKIDKINNNQNDDLSAPVLVFVEIGPNGKLYKNTLNNQIIEERIFVEKKFLIKDSLPEIGWKITKEKKEVLGFTCYKATATLKDKMKVTAWYSPKLNFKTGPDKFWGLPGLILEVETVMDYGNGEIETGKYIALKAESFKSNDKITYPSKGEEITEEAFQKYQKEFFDKQNEIYSGEVDKD